MARVLQHEHRIPRGLRVVVWDAVEGVAVRPDAVVLRNTVPTDSEQLGSYSFTISGSPGITPVVDVLVDGVLLKK